MVLEMASKCTPIPWSWWLMWWMIMLRVLNVPPLMKYKTISQASKKRQSMNWGWGLWIGEHHDILRRRIFEETIFPKKERWITSKAQEEYFKWKKPFLLYSLHLSLSLSEHLFIAISRQGWSGLSEPFHFRTAGPGDQSSDVLMLWATKNKSKVDPQMR